MAEHILLCTSQIRSFLKTNLVTSFVYGEPWIRNSDFFVKMGGKVDKGRWCVNFQKTRQHVELDIQVISVIHSKTKGIPPCPLWKHWISHKSWPVFSQDVFIYSLFFSCESLIPALFLFACRPRTAQEWVSSSTRRLNSLPWELERNI